MSRLRTLATRLIYAAAALTGYSANALADITEINFCNKYPYDVYVAIAYLQKDNGWISRGWLRVNSNACTYFDSALHVESFYYRGETDPYDIGNGRTATASWGDKGDRKFYVTEESFNYFDALKSAGSSSRLAGFSKFLGKGQLTTEGSVSTSVTFEADGTITYGFDPVERTAH